MAAEEQKKTIKKLGEISECSICSKPFTDPRILPCIHTFCLVCIDNTARATEKSPGEKMPCPLCRKEFVIPEDGVGAIAKNFFMANLIEVTTILFQSSRNICCDLCRALLDAGSSAANVPDATKRCLECRDNFCDRCARAHQLQKASKSHHVVRIGSETEEEIRRMFVVKNCNSHVEKPLDYYCTNCKKIVCVSCFVETHASHKCRVVTSVEDDFRQRIAKNAFKISGYSREMAAKVSALQRRKLEFLDNVFERQRDIEQKKENLKSIIDQHANSLLEVLSTIKQRQLEELKGDMEKIEAECTNLDSYVAYCNELTSRGSASDICGSVDELDRKATEFGKEHASFIERPYQLTELFFEKADSTDLFDLSKRNIVGKIGVITGETKQFENCVMVVGINGDNSTIRKDVLKINLHRPNEISHSDQVPSTMRFEAAVAVFCNTMYVTGIGKDAEEIWKYDTDTGWAQCSTMVQGRRRHSVAFLDEMLYICGGYVGVDKAVLDSVEAYNALTNMCTTVGKLAHCVRSTGNCVPFKRSLYIFGGLGENSTVLNYVQVYNTDENTCTILTKSLPRLQNLMRAVLWETSVILLGQKTSFIYNLETQTWQDRERFKTDVFHFGLVLENRRVYIIGGGDSEADRNGTTVWTCRDDVRYVQIENIIDNKNVDWKIHAKLPQPSLVQAFAKLRFAV